MWRGPKAIPNEKLRQVVRGISNKETLAKFVECSQGEVPLRDEGLVVGAAIGCPEELWRLPMIQSAVSKAVFQNYNVGLLFRLLSGTLNPSDLAPSLDGLLERRSPILMDPQLYKVFVMLHKQGLIHIIDFLLARLGLLSSIDLWCAAIMTFRICEPSLLLDRHLMRVPRIKSGCCRALLGILVADFTGNIEASSTMLAEGMNELCRLGKAEHSKVVILICHYCRTEGGGLASAVVREMAARKDHRDLEIVRIAAHISSLKAIKA